MHTRLAWLAALITPLISLVGCSEHSVARTTAPANPEISVNWVWGSGEIYSGTLGGWAARLEDINDNGTAAAGWVRSADGTIHAVVISVPSSSGSTPLVKDLGALTAPGRSQAYGLNNADPGKIWPKAVVGESLTASGAYHAVLWRLTGDDASSPKYEIVDLGTLGGTNSVATAVSNASVVVGSSEVAYGVWHGFRWTPWGLEDLDSLTRWHVNPYDVNDLGTIVGAGSRPGATNDIGVIVKPGEIVRPIGPQSSFPAAAAAISASGRIVGDVAFRYHEWRSFVSDGDNTWKVIGTPEGLSVDFRAVDINDYGQVVGNWNCTGSKPGGCHAVFWSGSGSLIDYSFVDLSKGSVNATVGGISSGRRVVGGKVLNGRSQAVIWWVDPPVGVK